jgi:hypothetical protein
MGIKINDLQLNMKNVIELFVKITSVLTLTTQMGAQISSFLKSSRKYKPKFHKKSISFNFFAIIATLLILELFKKELI